ncbi:MAG: hypothetical protein ACFNM7_05445, partial [Prevotella conceptionensis]
SLVYNDMHADSLIVDLTTNDTGLNYDLQVLNNAKHDYPYKGYVHGSFDVMPRTRDLKWVRWHRLRLTIHAPIMPIGQGTDNTKFLEEQSYQVIMGSLVPEYQGFEANPDQ